MDGRAERGLEERVVRAGDRDARLSARRGSGCAPAPEIGDSALVTSPFDPRAAIAENALGFAVRDRFPVSEGHKLVVPRREVATWFDATREEQLAILELVDVVRAQLDQHVPKPDGYNVGFNAGAAAGQTVMHLHVHVIPRFRGDVDDPRRSGRGCGM